MMMDSHKIGLTLSLVLAVTGCGRLGGRSATDPTLPASPNPQMERAEMDARVVCGFAVASSLDSGLEPSEALDAIAEEFGARSATLEAIADAVAREFIKTKAEEYAEAYPNLKSGCLRGLQETLDAFKAQANAAVSRDGTVELT